MILNFALIFLVKDGLASCTPWSIDSSGNALTVHDQLGYLFDECTGTDYGNTFKTFTPIADLVFEDGHGYYRSWTTVGALETIFKISDFTHDRLALVTSVLNNIYAIDGADALAPGTSFGYWAYIQQVVYMSVEVLYYDVTFYNAIVDGGFAYELMEFGNKDYQQSPLFRIFNDIWSIAWFLHFLISYTRHIFIHRENSTNLI